MEEKKRSLKIDGVTLELHAGWAEEARMRLPPLGLNHMVARRKWGFQSALWGLEAAWGADTEIHALSP